MGLSAFSSAFSSALSSALQPVTGFASTAGEIIGAFVPVKRPGFLLLIIPLFFVLLYIIRKNFVAFSSKEERKRYLDQNRPLRVLVFLTRFLAFSLLLVVLAVPYTIMDKEVEGEVTITLLADHSTSMRLFQQGLDTSLQGQLESYVPTKVVEIATGDASALGDAILANLDRDASVLIISDGNSNKGRDLGDALVLASQLNTTINMIDLEPLHGDTAVVIEGPASSIVGSDIALTAAVKQAGDPQQYSLTLEIDGNAVVSESGSGSARYDYTNTLSEGYHHVIARVAINDFFPENNVFYKTVHVIPKPHVAFVSDSTSPLLSELSTIYDVTVLDAIPSDLSPYSTIILNNLPIQSISNDAVTKLTDFVVDGGGLLVVGGKAAYDLGDYESSLFETLLPAKSGKGEREPDKKVALVMVIDISGSTGASVSGLGDASKVDMEKSLATRILDEDVRPEDKVGIVAFNSQAFVISPVSELGPKKGELLDKISKLQDGGGTHIGEGIKAAEQLLRDVDGSKNIILISDGITRDAEEAHSRIYGAGLAGVKTYTVGVGENTKSDFMIQAAKLGNGVYFQPEASQHLKLLFGEPEDDPTKKGLIVLDENHFITAGLELAGALAGYNQVVPKASASNLVVTGNGNPVLVTWRFGLGRVAALATDDGSAWGGVLLGRDNSKIFSRIINWAIGDPSKDKSRTVLVSDTYLGEPTEILLRSDAPPQSSTVEFSKIDERLYRGMVTPTAVGFVELLDADVAVNTKREYFDVGMNPQLSSLVALTGGKAFSPEDINGIVEHTKSAAKRTETREVPFQWPFLALALALFILDIFVRKIAEHRK